MQRPHLSLPSAEHPLQSTIFMYLDQTPHFGLLNLYMNPILETKQNNDIPLLLTESLLVKSSMISGWDQLFTRLQPWRNTCWQRGSAAWLNRNGKHDELKFEILLQLVSACHENLQQNWNQKLALGSFGLSNNTFLHAQPSQVMVSFHRAEHLRPVPWRVPVGMRSVKWCGTMMIFICENISGLSGGHCSFGHPQKYM